MVVLGLSVSLPWCSLRASDECGAWDVMRLFCGGVGG